MVSNLLLSWLQLLVSPHPSIHPHFIFHFVTFIIILHLIGLLLQFLHVALPLLPFRRSLPLDFMSVAIHQSLHPPQVILRLPLLLRLPDILPDLLQYFNCHRPNPLWQKFLHLLFLLHFLTRVIDLYLDLIQLLCPLAHCFDQ